MKTSLKQTNNLLKDEGLNIIFAPNYDFPYEPHFVLPIIINKKITEFFFKKKIKKSEIKTNEVGLWEGKDGTALICATVKMTLYFCNVNLYVIHLI